MRAEIRARMRNELPASRYDAASSSGVSHGRSLAPSSSSMEYDAYHLRRKISRLEGEQRVEMTASREEELEAARFELREMRMMR